MNKIIGVTELQRNFRAVFDEVVRRKIPYVLTRGSRPEAVIIPYDDWLRQMRLDRTDLMRRVDQLVTDMSRLNARYSDEEVERDLEEATRATRARKRSAKHRARS